MKMKNKLIVIAIIIIVTTIIGISLVTTFEKSNIGGPAEWIEHKKIVCDEGFKVIDGICKQLSKIREKDIPVFFEIQLMEMGIEWELADRNWANPDFEIEPPARICSHIIKDGNTELYISTIWEDEYSLSDMIIQKEMPNDCVKIFPVTEITKNKN